jgi:hypothetical protein
MANNDANHTTDELEAVREEAEAKGRAEGRAEAQSGLTPRPDESSDRIRRIVKPETKSIVKEAVRDHADHCRDEGALCTVADKVDKLNRSVLMAMGVIMLIGGMMPFFWARLSTRLDTLDRMQIDIVKLTAQQAGRASMAADVPAHFAQVPTP